MSTDFKIVGVLNNNSDLLKKRIAIVNNCRDLDVEIPQEIVKFFSDMDISIDDITSDGELHAKLQTKKFTNERDCESGYSLDVKDIPKDVKTIKFVFY